MSSKGMRYEGALAKGPEDQAPTGENEFGGGVGRASFIGDVAAQWLCNEQYRGIQLGYKRLLR